MSTHAYAQVKQPSAQAPSFTPANKGLMQRKCADYECRKKKLTLQRYSADNAEPSTVPPIVHEVLRSPGQPLDPATRAFMEPRFGHDFSRVRVHTDAKAAESARVVNAKAYTVGRDVVFGKYASGTIEGQRLIAHELTHVVQEHPRGYGVLRSFSLNPQGNLAEKEATKNANLVIGGGPFQVTQQIEPDILMRQPETKEEETPGIFATIGGGMVGEFNEDPTFAMIGVDMGVSLIPILDQVSDARDLTAHIYYMTVHEQYKNPGRWVGLVFTLIGLVPEIGSVIKSISKSAIKGIGELLSRLDEILKLVNKVFPEITDISRLQKYIAENWDRIVTMGKKTWGFALDRASYWVNLISKFIGERGRKIKEALDVIKEIAPQKLDEAFGWVRRQLDDILEKVREHLGHEAAKIEGSKAIPKPKIETSKRPFFEQDIDEAVEGGIVEEVESTTRPTHRPRPQRPATTGLAEAARKKFDNLRGDYARKLGVPSGGQVHHAIELQTLDRYPNVFKEAELNAFDNMRGLATELENRQQLHNAKIREIWDRHYRRIDAEIAQRELQPGTSAYNDFVRRNILEASGEIDHVLGQFFTEYRTGL